MRSLSTALLALTGAALASCTPGPSPPQYEFLFQTNFTIPAEAVVDFGPLPYGNRSYLGITGGTFAGPRMSGKVLVGADWGLTVRGKLNPDAVFAFEVDDEKKTKIFVTENGHIPDMFMMFETASKTYDWLNDAVAYAVGGPQYPGSPVIQLDVWKMGA